MRKRPLPGSATARVWEIADDLLRRQGSLPSGREVADLYVAEGGNEGTAFTQYSHWKKAYLNHFKRGSAAPRPEGGRALHLRADPAGRLVIPADVVAGMGVGPEGKVTARLEDGELVLIAPQVALRKLRAMVRQFDTGEGSPVDELIRERRAEAARE
jgi:hypothetical protein